jgi:enterochelin esterase-like enzyme
MRHSPITLALLLSTLPIAAQNPDDLPPGQAPRGFGAPVELGPDDKPAFPLPPKGFDEKRPGVPQGKTETIPYESKSVGTTRKLTVYTPPGYSSDKKYPVLYLLHGIGGDETEWQRFAPPEIILSNLIADKKAVEMIVVMPNGRAQKDDRAIGDVFRHAPAFAAFEQDLLKDVIPFIEKTYSVLPDRQNRALAGLSMGGGQSLNFGLGNLETFSWIGAFAPAPNTRQPAELIPNAKAAAKQLNLLFLSCGKNDGLIRISKGLHQYLEKNDLPHTWHVDENAHDTPHWRASLYHFSQLIFQKKTTPADPPR